MIKFFFLLQQCLALQFSSLDQRILLSYRLKHPDFLFANFSRVRPDDPNLSCHLDSHGNWMCIPDFWNIIDPEDSY